MFQTMALKRGQLFTLTCLLASLAALLPVFHGPVQVHQQGGYQAVRRGLANLNVLITNVGHATITGLIIKVGSGNGFTVPSYFGWGTGTTPAAATDTALTTAANEARVNGTTSQFTTSITSDTYRCQGTITSASNQTIAEAGLFDAAGSGTPPSGANLYMHAVFTGLPLNIGDSISFDARTQFV